MTDTTNSPAPRAPRLPDPGWLPDPGSPRLERYWDGTRWTTRLRHRDTGLEISIGPTRRERRPHAVLRFGAWTAGLAVVILGLGWFGLLPSWVPYSDSLVRPAPTGPNVQYPVFGSDEFVEYLARSMVAQDEVIDIGYWVHTEGRSTDDVWDALQEASAQNPYVFVSEWRQSATLTAAEIRPTYNYDDPEADRRRAATRAAVQVALADTGAVAADTDTAKATLVHDYITGTATYDHAAFDAIEATDGREMTPQIARSQEAYGILVEGTAVCNGYAQAFLLMADAAGLESVVVTGEANGGVYTGSHAWNRVLIDGEWKIVDATWNDHDAVQSGRDYFLLEDGHPLLDTRTVGDGWVVDAHRDNYFN